MPPYAERVERNSFNITDKTAYQIMNELVDWITRVMDLMGFYKFNYTIYVGQLLMGYVRTIITNKGYSNDEIFNFLDITRVVGFDDPTRLDDRSIKIK